ncbi:hypothetical protein FNU76_17970 [Chitinimonas arctica]|uniref:Uncharacterized protein n=1 Tax=Chitinimonas arctica TaxID=2594795 RepID=A0A516SIV0_9NEIS|nr:hypothetical protein [Chitinimonas arctica]QDQ28080.1 hypothetical protein FNU76_17970 [Chitinimonas arctica]
MRHLILAAMFAAAGSTTAIAAESAKPAKQGKPAAPAKRAAPVIDIKVRDVSPRFVEFYEAANKPLPVPPATPATPAEGSQAAAPATPALPVESESDRRWRMFKQSYNFTSQPDEAATRKALEAAWPRYAAVLPQIQEGFDGISASTSAINTKIGDQLQLEQAMSLRFITYVGTFDGRVWSTVDGERLNINLPLEVSAEVRNLPLSRILARAMLERSAAWGTQPRNLVEFAVGEGVLAHAAQSAVPGLSPEAYLDLTPEQFAKARDNKKADLKMMVDKLEDGSPATMAAYSGEKLAQARYAGWMLVESFLKDKSRLADMIRQRPDVLVKASRVAMASIIRAK